MEATELRTDGTGRLVVTCPAAEPIAGPPVGGPSVLCGVIRKARADLVTTHERETDFGVLNSMADHPRTLAAYCCASYRDCPLWKRELETQAESRKFARTPEEKRAEFEANERAGIQAGLRDGPDASPADLVG